MCMNKDFARGTSRASCLRFDGLLVLVGLRIDSQTYINDLFDWMLFQVMAPS